MNHEEKILSLLEQIENKLSAMDTKIDAHHDEMRSNFDNVNARLLDTKRTVNKRFEEVDATIKGLIVCLDMTDEDVKALERKAAL